MQYMSKSLARWLEALAANSPNDEICGFIFEDWTFAQVKNIAAAPGGNFYMDQEHQAQVLVGKPRPIGIFHSHPGGRVSPSQTDLVGWPMWPVNDLTNQLRYSRYWIIVRGMVIEWKRDNEHSYGPVWEHAWGPKEDLAQPFRQRPERVGS